MNDPLDAVFVTGDEAAELKRTDTARKLATYLERMPAELLRLFGEQFQHISTSELAQLRADLQAAQERIAQLETTIALNRYITPPFDLIDDATAQLAIECSEKDDRIAEQARQLEGARTILQFIGKHDYPNGTLRNAASNWLAANPAPREPQPPNGDGRP